MNLLSILKKAESVNKDLWLTQTGRIESANCLYCHKISISPFLSNLNVKQQDIKLLLPSHSHTCVIDEKAQILIMLWGMCRNETSKIVLIISELDL